MLGCTRSDGTMFGDASWSLRGSTAAISRMFTARTTGRTERTDENSARSNSPSKFTSSTCSMATSFIQERLTITPVDHEVVRGTSVHVLLESFGMRLRRCAGGIADGTAVDEYPKSFVVDALDIFLSHSWHAPWKAKYFALIFYFNLMASVVAVTVFGILHFFVMQLGLLPDMLFIDTQLEECNEKKEFGGLALVLGVLMFVVLLITWHNIASRVGMGTKSLFLDQVCINQINPTVKIRGVRSIGAILARSRKILVAWDGTYFTRLWCTYELSAFRFAKPQGRIVVVPVELGMFVFIYVVVNLAKNIVLTSATWISSHRETVPDGLYQTFWGDPMQMLIREIIPYACVLPCARRYMSDRLALQSQINEFSIRQSRCFCCDNNHVHPRSGVQLSCDRELVYKSVAHWYGDGNMEQGLDSFDLLIRNSLHFDIAASLGRECLLPYFWAVGATMTDQIFLMSFKTGCPFLRHFLPLAELVLLREPLFLAFLLYLSRIGLSRRLPFIGKCVICVVVVGLCVVVKDLLDTIGDDCLFSFEDASDLADEEDEHESANTTKGGTYISMEQVWIEYKKVQEEFAVCSRYMEDYPTRCFCFIAVEVLILGSLYGLPNISRFIRKFGRDRGPQPATELTALASMRGPSAHSGTSTSTFGECAGGFPASS